MLDEVVRRDPCFRRARKTPAEVGFCRRVLMAYTRALVLSDPVPLPERLVELLLDVLLLPDARRSRREGAFHSTTEKEDSPMASAWFLYSSFLREVLSYDHYSQTALAFARRRERGGGKPTPNIDPQYRSLIPETPEMANLLYDVAVSLGGRGGGTNKAGTTSQGGFPPRPHPDRARWSTYLFSLSFQRWVRLGRLDLAAVAAYAFYPSQPDRVVRLLVDIYDSDGEGVDASGWMDALRGVLACAAFAVSRQANGEIDDFQAAVERVRFLPTPEDFPPDAPPRAALEFIAYYEQIQEALFSCYRGGLPWDEYRKTVLDPFKDLYDLLACQSTRASSLGNVESACEDGFV
ncbi:unnamed protein product [Phytomonas sp. EM1]|nr:unnamed protein product [Phytomonas sp. EM1]|eukprot:CCW63955.1 unnamed protein product [Phytomonas sp. isolate EM1]